jgi:hypothetical protein
MLELQVIYPQSVLNEAVELCQHIADIDGLQGPPAAFLVVGGGMIDIEIRGIGEVTS